MRWKTSTSRSDKHYLVGVAVEANRRVAAFLLDFFKQPSLHFRTKRIVPTLMAIVG